MAKADKPVHFWEQKPKGGRPAKFNSPEHLWGCAVEYFEWVEANPLKEEKLFHYQGVVSKEEVSKMRAMTVAGLCVFVGMGESTWSDYKNNPEFSAVTRKIDSIMRQQKFTGAAADMLNANIIARDLGLADKQDHHVVATELTDEQINEKLEALIASSK